jgi:Protein of unknwon function (DUF3310)
MTQQVGGTHYATGGREHWDILIECWPESYVYFAGVATKYICRWRKKGGVEDLKKAVTYLEKIASSAVPITKSVTSVIFGLALTKAYGLTVEEHEICRLIALGKVNAALIALDSLIQVAGSELGDN